MNNFDHKPFVHSFDTRRHAYNSLSQDRKSSEFVRLRDISRTTSHVRTNPSQAMTEGQRRAIKAAMKSHKIGVASGKVEVNHLRVKLF